MGAEYAHVDGGCCRTCYAKWEGVAVDGFRSDCDAKQLTFMSQQKDAGKLTALGRALKFAQKGWTLPVEQAAEIILHWEDPECVPAAEKLQRAMAAPYSRAERRAAVVHSFSPHYGRL